MFQFILNPYYNFRDEEIVLGRSTVSPVPLSGRNPGSATTVPNLTGEAPQLIRPSQSLVDSYRRYPTLSGASASGHVNRPVSNINRPVVVSRPATNISGPRPVQNVSSSAVVQAPRQTTAQLQAEFDRLQRGYLRELNYNTLRNPTPAPRGMPEIPVIRSAPVSEVPLLVPAPRSAQVPNGYTQLVDEPGPSGVPQPARPGPRPVPTSQSGYTPLVDEPGPPGGGPRPARPGPRPVPTSQSGYTPLVDEPGPSAVQFSTPQAQRPSKPGKVPGVIRGISRGARTVGRVFGRAFLPLQVLFAVDEGLGIAHDRHQSREHTQSESGTPYNLETAINGVDGTPYTGRQLYNHYYINPIDEGRVGASRVGHPRSNARPTAAERRLINLYLNPPAAVPPTPSVVPVKPPSNIPMPSTPLPSPTVPVDVPPPGIDSSFLEVDTEIMKTSESNVRLAGSITNSELQHEQLNQSLQILYSRNIPQLDTYSDDVQMTIQNFQ